MNKTLYGIVGPTASGKTELAVRAALKLGAEVVSADSMQVYEGMDILSAKPTKAETWGIAHHLIGFVKPSEKYNASKYRADALRAIDDIRARGKTPLLCGGTGLYVDALTRGIKMAEEADEETRRKLKAIAEQDGGAKQLHDMLASVDPDSARKYPQNDVRRVIRSLEIFFSSGKTRGEYEKLDAATPDENPAVLYALKWDRKTLYARIDARVDEMLKNGLADEVKQLLDSDSDVQETASQAIGFKEIKQALEGCISLDEATELVKLNTRHLAKRQETWFRKDARVIWLETDGSNFGKLTQTIVDDITQRTEAENGDKR